MSTGHMVVQWLTVGGVAAFIGAIVQAVSAFRKLGPERNTIVAGTNKVVTETERARVDLEMDMLRTAQEQLAFWRSEIDTMRDRFAKDREERIRTIMELQLERDDLARRLASAEAELTMTASRVELG